MPANEWDVKMNGIWYKDKLAEAIGASPFDTCVLTWKQHEREIAAKDVRIAELEKQVAEMKSDRLRAPGAYYVVPKETMDAKDARIKELESRESETSAVDRTAESLLIGQLQHEIALLKRDNAELNAWLKTVRDMNAKRNRLVGVEGKYDKGGVGGISLDAAIGAARLAGSMLNQGHKLSYAAACLLVVSLELESTRN